MTTSFRFRAALVLVSAFAGATALPLTTVVPATLALMSASMAFSDGR